MKKTLIALAVLAASTASMAQVTLYGVADVGIGSSDKAQSAVGVNSAYALPNTNIMAVTNGNSGLNDGNSRFGMRGVEDLGGGLKAGFNFESSIDLASGATNGSGGTLFARAANVSLSGGFGSLTVGRQLTPSFLALAQWELTGTANYSVTMGQFGSVVGGSNNVARDVGMAAYSTPNMGGFVATVGAVLEGNGVYGTAAAPKGKYDIAATYNAGPIAVGLGYNKVDAGKEGTTIGGSFNFGMVKVAASWNSQKDGAGNKQVEGYTLGASLPMGPWTFTGDIATVQSGNALLAGQSSDTNVLLNAKYALSKRTFVYGVYIIDNKGINTQDTNAYSLGLRHNF
jgi:predicted porin